MMDKMQNKPDALLRSNNIPKSGKSPRVIRNFRKYGFADSDGNIIISCVYDSARPFREGMAAVKYHEKWGFVNESGEQVIPFIYDCVWPFRKGVALVEKDGRWVQINKSGHLAIPGICDEKGDFLEGVTGYYHREKWYITDHIGRKWVLSEQKTDIRGRMNPRTLKIALVLLAVIVLALLIHFCISPERWLRI